MIFENRETIQFTGSKQCVKCGETYAYILVKNSKGELVYATPEGGRRVGNYWLCPEC